MEFDAQRIIEQAQAEIQPTEAAQGKHPAPEAIETLHTIAAEAVQLNEILAKLHELDLPLTRTEAEIAITGLHDITTRGAITAWKLGLHAVEQGLINQTQLADMLGVNKGTVSRRYRTGVDEAGERKDGSH